MHGYFHHVLRKSIGQVGEFHENARTLRIFWRKVFSLRSMLSDNMCEGFELNPCFTVWLLVSFLVYRS